MLLALVFVLPDICFAAIVLENYTAGTFTSNTSFSFTTSGDNRILLVFYQRNTDHSTSVTYDGSAATYSGYAALTPGGNYDLLWYQTNPTLGSNTLALGSNNPSALKAYVVMQFSGVDTSDPFDVFGTLDSQSATTTPLQSVTSTTADGMAVWGLGMATAEGNVSGASGTTKATGATMTDGSPSINGLYKSVSATGAFTVNGLSSASAGWSGVLTILNAIQAPSITNYYHPQLF